MSGAGADGLVAREHPMTDKVNAVYLMTVEIWS